MVRIFVVALASFLAAQVGEKAHASTVTYDLTFSPTGSYTIGGGGTFELSGPISNSGSHSYSLSELSIAIDGNTYTLASDPSARATFTNGNFSGLSYDASTPDGLFTFQTLSDAGLDYTLTDTTLGFFNDIVSEGTISAVDPPSVAPLPASIVMFATGLMAFGFMALWKRAVGLRNPAPAFVD
jgi:hypothetical protein